MKNSKLVLTSLMNAVGVTAYIAIVSTIIRNGEKIFGKMNNVLGPIAFLLLFVLSATITGALVLGKPVLLFLEGKKIESITLFCYTIAWLVLITIAIFFLLLIF